MDKLKGIIDQLKLKVEAYFDNEKSGHSIDHLQRTYKNAMAIQKKEGGDAIVVGISAYIHDIHRIMQAKEGKYVQPKDSLPVVEEFLKDIDITQQQKNLILKAIEHHEEYVFGKAGVNVNELECRILQDADNLDAIGAVGIVRVFKYGIAHNMPDYDDKIPLYRVAVDDSIHDASSIHHIYNKLIRLDESMHTKTAKKMAKSKIKLMKPFINMYLEEWA